MKEQNPLKSLTEAFGKISQKLENSNNLPWYNFVTVTPGSSIFDIAKTGLQMKAAVYNRTLFENRYVFSNFDKDNSLNLASLVKKEIETKVPLIHSMVLDSCSNFTFLNEESMVYLNIYEGIFTFHILSFDSGLFASVKNILAFLKDSFG